MKIAVIGSGAMGSLYGGILAENGHEVYLIDVYEPHVNKINEAGLSIVKDGQERIIKNVKATTDSTVVGIVDLALVFVKSTITDIAVKQNSCLFDDNTIVLTLQNGAGNIEKINTVVKSEQIIAGTSANGASMLGPGKINHAGNGGTVIGELNGCTTDRIINLQKLLDVTELGPCKISNNVVGLIWDKLLVNVGINALTALTGLKNGQLLENKESIEILEKAVNEGIAVANRLGIKLTYNNSEHCKDVCRKTSKNTSSMLADVLNKRRTEVENINGVIAREGKKLGIDTPINETLTNLILLKERYY